MRYYSDVTKKVYNTEKELVEAEAKIKAETEAKARAEKVKTEQRATRAKEVEAALKEANKARNKAVKLLQDFTRDYGYFHMTYCLDETDQNDQEESVSSRFTSRSFLDILNEFLK